MSLQLLSDGDEPHRFSGVRFFEVSIALSAGTGVLVGAIVALFFVSPMFHDARVVDSSSLVALHALGSSVGEQTPTTLGRESIRQKELALLSNNHAMAGNHERDGTREAYGLRSQENPVASTQLYEGRLPGTQQFGDQAYPFQEKSFKKDRQNHPYAFGTNQYREMREAYGMRTNRGPAATSQLYEGERPEIEQFRDQPYPFQEKNDQSSSQLYEGERPEIEPKNKEKIAASWLEKLQKAREAYGMITKEQTAASNQKSNNYEREPVESEGGPMQDTAEEDWDDWDTWQRQSESFATARQ